MHVGLDEHGAQITGQELREQIERYKRLLNATLDEAVRNVLLSLIAEAEQNVQSCSRK